VGQRARSDEFAAQTGPDVPPPTGQSVDRGVDDERPVGLVGLPGEGKTGGLADDARPAVGADDVPAAYPFAGGQRRGHAVVVLFEAVQCDAELDAQTEAVEQPVQDGVGA
jgi:hypothetical protein